MMNKKCFLQYALLLFVMLAAPAFGQEKTIEPVQKAKQDAERRQRIADIDVNTLLQDQDRRFMNLEVCVGHFTVVLKDGNEGHINIDDKFLVIGPIPVIDAFVIRPKKKGGGKWNHPWVMGSYAAIHNPVYRNWYDMQGVSVAPHGTETMTDHTYSIEAKNWDVDDCPTYIDFHHGYHPYSSARPLDPGHAGASRD